MLHRLARRSHRSAPGAKAASPRSASGRKAGVRPHHGVIVRKGIDFERYIEAVELSLIRRSLERTRGNKRQAAKLLNLKRTTLIEKLKRLDPPTAAKV